MEFSYKVSVVMPAFNAARFIGEAIDSVIAQSYENWELWIIDDCSSDNTYDIALSYQKRDARIHAVKGDVNKGVSYVRNKGILLSDGAYVALLDSDDTWTPDKLEKQLSLIEDTKANIAYCSYDFIDEFSSSIKKPFIVPETTNFNKMLGQSVISCSTVLIDSKLIKEHLFRTDFYHEDYVLWMELLSQPEVKAAGCQDILAHYRQVSGSRSNNKGNSAKQRWDVYRDGLGLGIFRSFFAFVSYAIHGVLKYYF